jgi:ABC-type transporter Mla subunit MlaD
MQLIDPMVAIALVVVVGIVAVAAVVLAAVAVPSTLRETRSDRKARRESIPAYYGRLHFAH